MGLQMRTTVCRTCRQDVTLVDGEALRRLRLAAKKPLRVAGAHIGVTEGYLSDIERNKRNVTERVLKGYRQLFNGGAA